MASGGGGHPRRAPTPACTQEACIHAGMQACSHACMWADHTMGVGGHLSTHVPLSLHIIAQVYMCVLMNMYVYVYFICTDLFRQTYMYVCASPYVHIYIHMLLFTRLDINPRRHTRYICIHIHICVCMYVCINVYIQCYFILMHVLIYFQWDTKIRRCNSYICLYINIHSYTHLYTIVQSLHIYVPRHIYTYAHLFMFKGPAGTNAIYRIPVQGCMEA